MIKVLIALTDKTLSSSIVWFFAQRSTAGDKRQHMLKLDVLDKFAHAGLHLLEPSFALHENQTKRHHHAFPPRQRQEL